MTEQIDKLRQRVIAAFKEDPTDPAYNMDVAARVQSKTLQLLGELESSAIAEVIDVVEVIEGIHAVGILALHAVFEGEIFTGGVIEKIKQFHPEIPGNVADALALEPSFVRLVLGEESPFARHYVVWLAIADDYFHGKGE